MASYSSSIATYSTPKQAISPFDLYFHATEKQQDFDWELLMLVEQERARCGHVKVSLGRFRERSKFLDRLTEKLPRSCPPVAVNTPAVAVAGEALAMDIDGPSETSTSEESLETRCQDGELMDTSSSEESLETRCQDAEPMDASTSDSTGSPPVLGPQDVVGPCTANQLWRWPPYGHVRMPYLESLRESRWIKIKNEAVQKWRRDNELRAKQGSKPEIWQSGSGAFGAVGGSLGGY